MVELALAAIFLPLSHFGISSTPLRGWLVDRVGARPYLGIYSVVAAGAFWWLVSSYRGADVVPLWFAPPTVRWIAVAVVFVAFLITIPGLLTPNPTTVDCEALFDRPDVVSGILRVSRNPFLWGVTLWAFAHVVVAGDLAAILLFASVGSLSLLGAPVLDAKKARQFPKQWESFSEATSSMPFLAIAEGRQRFDWREIGLWRIAIAVAAFFAVIAIHPWLFGVSPLPAF